MTAVYGGNFCSSAKDAFSLLMRNFLRWNIILKSLAIKTFLNLTISAIITRSDDYYILNFRVFILDNVCDFLLLLGKLVIVGSVGCLSFFVFSGKHNFFRQCKINYTHIWNFTIIFAFLFNTYYLDRRAWWRTCAGRIATNELLLRSSYYHNFRSLFYCRCFLWCVWDGSWYLVPLFSRGNMSIEYQIM